jgi:hypothetical protein
LAPPHQNTIIVNTHKWFLFLDPLCKVLCDYKTRDL